MVKFLRGDWKRSSKLGKKRKKKQIWRSPKGRHNKMREKRKNYPAIVSIGYRTNNQDRGKIKGEYPEIVRNLKDLEKINGNKIAIMGNIGKKKKIEIVKKAKELKVNFINLNVKKFLKKTEKENKK